MIFALPFLLFAALSPQQVRYPQRPAEREFLVDEAGIVKPEDAAEIRLLCDEVLTQKKVPIKVVTIPSLAACGAGDRTVERYTRDLFNEWRIGWPEWNYGFLFLVSNGDKKLWIEAGSGWRKDTHEAVQHLIETRIVPRFRDRDMSKGILDGVLGLRSIAMGLKLPGAGLSRRPGGLPDVRLCGGGSMIWVIIVIAVLALLSLSRRRRTVGWGPGYGRSPGCGSGFGSGCLGALIGNMIFGGMGRRGSSWGSSGGRSSGGSWGGGSYGGGSGGGGAGGSW